MAILEVGLDVLERAAPGGEAVWIESRGVSYRIERGVSLYAIRWVGEGDILIKGHTVGTRGKEGWDSVEVVRKSSSCVRRPEYVLGSHQKSPNGPKD